MDIETFREYCLGKKGVTEHFPFDEDTLVFKVMGKMFSLISLSNPGNANLKCDPEKAIQLREEFPCVIPGWHMSKKHWNTVFFNQEADDRLIKEWIDHSYDMVVKGLPKKIREQL